MTENVKHVEELKKLRRLEPPDADERAAIDAAIAALQREAAGDGEACGVVDGMGRGNEISSKATLFRPLPTGTKLYTAPRPTGTDQTSPANCRNRLMAEGKPYPRSGCAHCKLGGLTGCPYEKAVHTTPASAEPGEVLDALKLLRDSIDASNKPECYWDISEAVARWIADANIGKPTPNRHEARGGGDAVEGLRCWVNVYRDDGAIWAYETEEQAKSDASLATKRVAVPMQEVTHPTPAALDADAKDAARYRWLLDNADIDSVFYDDTVKLAFPAPDIDGFNDLSDVIDAARATTGASE